MSAEPFVVSPETCSPATHVPGINVAGLASNARTRGRAIALQARDAGAGPPPHRHKRNESFHVLRGPVQITIEGLATPCTPGMRVHVPAGTVHGRRFWHGGSKRFGKGSAGANATRVFNSIRLELPPAPADVPKLAALLQDNGVTLMPSVPHRKHAP